MCVKVCGSLSAKMTWNTQLEARAHRRKNFLRICLVLPNQLGVVEMLLLDQTQKSGNSPVLYPRRWPVISNACHKYYTEQKCFAMEVELDGWVLILFFFRRYASLGICFCKECKMNHISCPLSTNMHSEENRLSRLSAAMQWMSIEMYLTTDLLSHFNGDGYAGNDNQLLCPENYTVIFKKPQQVTVVWHSTA